MGSDCGGSTGQPSADGVTVERDDGRAVLHVHGEIDIATSPLFDDAVERTLAEGATELVVDLSAVTFMGSSGLASLLRAQRRAGEEGGRLLLRHPSRAVADVLDMTKLTERFSYEEG